MPCRCGAGTDRGEIIVLPLIMLLPPPGLPSLVYTPVIIGTGLVLAGLIALFSTAIPAARIARLDAATALTDRGPVPVRDNVDEREINFPAEQVSTAVPAPDAVTSADLRLLRQIIVVTRIGLLTLRQRRRGALTITVSVGCVMLALLPLSAAGEGIRVALLVSGDPYRVVVHAGRLGSTLATCRTAPHASLPPHQVWRGRRTALPWWRAKASTYHRTHQAKW